MDGLNGAKSELPPGRRAPGKPDDPSAPNGGADVEEYVSVGGDDDEFPTVDLADGSTLVYLEKPVEGPGPRPSEFYANLAEVLPDTVMSDVVTGLLRKIDLDKKAREKRDKQQEEGLKRTGLGKDAPGGAEFDGASKVVHPMIQEACIDFEARIIKELFPPMGPVKPNILGVVTKEKDERARRKTEHMNYQITQQIKEAYPIMETTLTQVPLGGVAYIHQWWDHRLKRPRWQFVPVDNVYLPYSAADFASSHRRTFKEDLTDVDILQRVEEGRYRKVELPKTGMPPDQSKSEKANDKIEGRDDPGENVDGEREVYEVMTYIEVTDEHADYLGFEQPGRLYPYLISIDVGTRQVLSWYRDWEAEDDTREPIEHLFEFPFIPWRGAYAIGLPQIIGGLSAAATGALRALLDSALVNNVPSAIMKKGSGTSGRTVRAQIGEIVELDTGLEADDIRKVLMPFPFNAPQPVLLQLLQFIVEAARGTVRTSLDDSAINATSNTPVGTQYSRVQEGMVVYSAAHARTHRAFNRLLMGLHRLNRLYLPDEPLRVDAAGKEILVSRKDYEGPCDVQPTSDATIYSDMQRMMQISAIQQRMTVAPGVYNPHKVEEAFLRLLKWPDPDGILVDQPQPHELNAVNESLSMTLGQPVKAFPEQDHLAHIQVHVTYMDNPLLGGNPLIAPRYLPLALQHIAEHIAFFFVTHAVSVARDAAQIDPAELMSNDPETKQLFDRFLAQSTNVAMQGVDQALAGLMPSIQKAQAMLQAMQPKPPLDPAVAAATQATMAETQRKGQADQMTNQLETARLGVQQQQNQARNALDAQRNAAQFERNDIARDNAQLSSDTKVATTQAEIQSAEDIASMKIGAGGGTSLSDGRSMEGA